MKIRSLTLIIIILSLTSAAQTPREIIAKVIAAQKKIHSAAYHVVRHDTLVTNDVRILSGDVTVDGLRFRVHQEGKDNIRMYDGKIGYDLYNGSHQYKSYEKLPGGYFYNDGAQLIVKDLLQLDTSRTVNITMKSNPNSYDINFYYPDLTAYDVSQRRKTVTISRRSWLPQAVREHQVTLGRVQDLYYEISGVQVEVPLIIELLGYTLKTPILPDAAANVSVLGTAFPFSLKSLNGPLVSLESAKGKIILLDFWEVWCGPCIESMPKVEALYEKFRDQGLEIYGISHDSAQTVPARELVKKFRLTFPTLIGTPETKAKYAITSLPTYILIDGEGTL